MSFVWGICSFLLNFDALESDICRVSLGKDEPFAVKWTSPEFKSDI